eukprot:459658-Prymnesium_polylepis.1
MRARAGVPCVCLIGTRLARGCPVLASLEGIFAAPHAIRRPVPCGSWPLGKLRSWPRWCGAVAALALAGAQSDTRAHCTSRSMC